MESVKKNNKEISFSCGSTACEWWYCVKVEDDVVYKGNNEEMARTIYGKLLLSKD